MDKKTNPPSTRIHVEGTMDKKTNVLFEQASLKGVGIPASQYAYERQGHH
jgi:hypothetical protein